MASKWPRMGPTPTLREPKKTASRCTPRWPQARRRKPQESFKMAPALLRMGSKMALRAPRESPEQISRWPPSCPAWAPCRECTRKLQESSKMAPTVAQDGLQDGLQRAQDGAKKVSRWLPSCTGWAPGRLSQGPRQLQGSFKMAPKIFRIGPKIT